MANRSDQEQILEMLQATITTRDWESYLLFRKALLTNHSLDRNWIFKELFKRLPAEDLEAYTEYFRSNPMVMITSNVS